MKTLAITSAALAALLQLEALREDARSSQPEEIVLPAPATDADFYDDGAAPADKVELGRLLFFDKVLSGNKNISCATCHHPRHGTSDGVALGLGEGATGLGPDRRGGHTLETGIHERVPRNSPALFNLGAREFSVLFHDGRVEVDEDGNYESGFISPARWRLPKGLDSVLAAQVHAVLRAVPPQAAPPEVAQPLLAALRRALRVLIRDQSHPPRGASGGLPLGRIQPPPAACVGLDARAHGGVRVVGHAARTP